MTEEYLAVYRLGREDPLCIHPREIALAVRDSMEATDMDGLYTKPATDAQVSAMHVANAEGLLKKMRSKPLSPEQEERILEDFS